MTMMLLILLALPDVARLQAHVQALTGVRKGGSAAERRAAEYVARQLSACGYSLEWQEVPLPGGKRSLNLVATRGQGLTYLVGAHLDSKPPSPGANDNASGVAACLEVA